MRRFRGSMDEAVRRPGRACPPRLPIAAAVLLALAALPAAACIDGSREKFLLAAQWCPSVAGAREEHPAEPAQQLSLYGPPDTRPRTVRDARDRALVQPAPAVVERASPPASVPLSMRRALQLVPDVDATARAHDIDPLLLHAIAEVESRHDARAVSTAGARGLMQVMPATARRFGVHEPHRELHDVRTNLGASAAYLKWLQRRYGNDLKLVLAAYNAGEGAVEKYGRRVPPYRETQRYVTEVLDRYLRWKRQQSELTLSSTHR